jgi:hypothetical protein
MTKIRCDKLNLPFNEIVNLYESGLSVSAVAKIFNCDYRTIYNRFIENHTKLRTLKEAVRRGDLSPFWKGENVSYRVIHHWLEKNFGKANHCMMCGKKDKKKYEWANIDHKYKRDRSCYIQLCTSCHRIFDAKDCGAL